MIVSPALVIIYPLIVLDTSITNHMQPQSYIPYTTTSMNQDSEKFYNNFWNSIFKEAYNEEQLWKWDQ